MDIYLFKLNGWPGTYDERIRALSQSVDITFIRTAPTDDTDDFTDLDNVDVYNVYPRRGSYINPKWLKPVIFPTHVFQAFVIAIFLAIRKGLPDVIHALDYVLGGSAAVATATLLRCPLVVSVRGYKEPIYRSILEERQTVRARINYWILILLSRIVLSQASHIITKAEYQRGAVKRAINDSPGLSTVPTGVDFERFDPSSLSSEDYLSELFPDAIDNQSSDSFRLLYFGQVIPQKGVDTLLEHIKSTTEQLPDDLVVIIVGECRTESFCEKVDKLKVETPQQVLFHPSQIPFDDVPNLLASVDAVSLLSEPGHEGVPRVLQEACAMRTPIIASEVSGIEGAFRGLPGCILIERDDTLAFADAVNELYAASPEMNRGIFKPRFDMYENYNYYSDIYESVIKTVE